MSSAVTDAQQPEILLKDGERDQWLRCHGVRQLISCTQVADVIPRLRDVESWVERGFFAAGFVSYEAAAAFHPLSSSAQASPLPLVWFAICEAMTVDAAPQPTCAWPPLAWQPDCSRSAYRDRLEQIHQAIARGETYQVNFTYSLQAQTDEAFDPRAFFAYLNHHQQGRYAGYLDLGSHVICSASPELFFSTEDQRIVTRPMKGTAARGADAEEDQCRGAWLQNSPKNRAENLMIVDMLRNDLGRLARVGSVRVRDLYRLEAYPTVWQLTSTVEAQLPADCGLVEQFKALFPCASITGAPKQKTMDWIARLESQPRGIYTGAVGFLTPEGRSQFNVAIRTAVWERKTHQLHYGVGGGIVWDSDPESEWRETRLKARVLPGIGDYSLLETLLWRPDQGFRHLDYHLRRLEHSGACLGIPVNRYRIRQQLIAATAAASPRWWRVRCLVDDLGRITCQLFPYQRQPQTRPLRLALAATAVDSEDPWLRHKTDQRSRYEALRKHAPAADDVLMYNQRGEITESTTANVVVYREGRWVTPPVSCGLLPGTMRQRLLDEGRLEERVLTLADLRQTDVYLINSLRGWRWARLEEGELPCRKQ